MAGKTQGYEVGTAYVQVLPSFRDFHKRARAEMAGLRDVEINVEPKVATREAEKAVHGMSERLSKTPVTQKVVGDTRQFQATVAKLHAKRDSLLLKIDADISAAQARIQELENKRGNTKIDVDAEIAKAQAKIAYLESKRVQVNVDVDADVGAAQAKLHQVENDLKRLNSTDANLRIEAEDASRAIALMGLLTAAVAALGAAAPAAAAAVALIPAGVLAAGQGITALVAGLNGVGDAVGAMQAVQDESVTKGDENAKRRIGAANRVASAEESLQAALINADRQAIQSAQQLRDAREGVADAQENAARRVQDAERGLQAAQVAARDAQEALTRARKDAVERLNDLRIATTGAALDEQAAVLAVERARERLNEARRSGAANLNEEAALIAVQKAWAKLDDAQRRGVSGTALAELNLAAKQAQAKLDELRRSSARGLDLAELALGVRQAEQNLTEVRERYGDLKQEATEASKAGVKGNADVIAAQRRVGEATQGVQDAERDLRDARVQGAKDVAKAQERVAQAQQQASWAAADASRQIASAQRSLAEASVAVGETGSAAADKLALAWSKLTPQGRAFATFLQGEVKPALQEIGDAASETLLPRLQTAFGNLITLAPEAKAVLAETGVVIGDLAVEGSRMMTSGPWRKDFATIGARNNEVIGLMGSAGLSTLDAFRSLTVASGPFVSSIARATDATMAQFNAWIQGKRDSGELQAWFFQMSARIQDVWASVKDLITGVWELSQALSPLGQIILEVIGPFAKWIGDFAKANPVITQAVAIMVLLGSTFVSTLRSIGGVSGAVRDALKVFHSLGDRIRGTRTDTDAMGTALDNAGSSAERTGGLMGRFRGYLDNVKASYVTGATAAGEWAAATGTRAALGANKLSTELFGVSKKVQENGTQMGMLSSRAVSTMTTVSGAVGGAATAFGTGLRGAISGVIGVLGGPLGIALTIATIGLGALAQAQADAAKAAADHEARVKTFSDALVKTNGVIDDTIVQTVALDLANAKAADNADHFKLGYERTAVAIAKGGDAWKQLKGDIDNTAASFTKNFDLWEGQQFGIDNLTASLLKNGGSADSTRARIDEIVNSYDNVTNASDEQVQALENELIQWADYVGAVGNAKSAQGEAKISAEDIADAENAAATATERHTNALKALNDEVLGTINKDLAYRQSVNGVADAKKRLKDVLANEKSTTQEITAARQAEESAILQQITAAGELAYSTSTANTESGKQRDSLLAQAREAANLANTYKGPLPRSLQQYLDKIGVAKSSTGEWIAVIDKVPPKVLSEAQWKDKKARQAIADFRQFMMNKLSATDILKSAGLAVTPANLRALQQEKRQSRALGAIAVAGYANGGVRPMAASVAEIVPPNQPRLIGDRMVGDEAFIPLNHSPRSLAILAQAAKRMGFGLLPMARGAVLGFASGGTAKPGTPAVAAPGGGDAALTVEPGAIDGLTNSVGGLVTAGLNPLAETLTGTVAPAMGKLEEHAGVRAVASVSKLGASLIPLRGQFTATSAHAGNTWAKITATAQNSTARQGTAMAALRTGMGATRSAMTNTASWAVSQYGRMQEAAARPVRWVISNPFNRGIVASWNRLNADFALKKPVKPIAIPFRAGGTVPGVGRGDKVSTMLEPQEIVFDRQAIANLGGVHEVERFRRMARAGLVGSSARLGNRRDAKMRLQLMRDYPLDGLGFAYGGVVPHVAAAGQEIERKFGRLPGGIGGVGSRPNASDHPSGHALDFMTMTNTALGNRIAAYMQSNAKRLLVKYLIWQQKYNGGRGWSMMEDRGSPTANHLDHVHASFLAAGLAGRAFTGGLPFADPSSYFSKALVMAGQVPSMFPGNRAAAVAGGVATQAIKAVINHANEIAFGGGVPGNVESYRPLVTQALRMLGLPASWADITLRRMAQESNGNPRAINLSDVNAQRGDPSKGLMQVIESTFRAYRDPRAPNDIWNPLANILASMRYTVERYGDLPTGYGRVGGYDDGGLLPYGYSTVWHGKRTPDKVLSDNQWSAIMSLAGQSGGGQYSGDLYLYPNSGVWLGSVRGEIDRANSESGRVLARGIR